MEQINSTMVSDQSGQIMGNQIVMVPEGLCSEQNFIAWLALNTSFNHCEPFYWQNLKDSVHYGSSIVEIIDSTQFAH